jgi:hypothetical protein
MRTRRLCALFEHRLRGQQLPLAPTVLTVHGVGQQTTLHLPRQQEVLPRFTRSLAEIRDTQGLRAPYFPLYYNLFADLSYHCNRIHLIIDPVPWCNFLFDKKHEPGFAVFYCILFGLPTPYHHHRHLHYHPYDHYPQATCIQ